MRLCFASSIISAPPLPFVRIFSRIQQAKFQLSRRQWFDHDMHQISIQEKEGTEEQ